MILNGGNNIYGVDIGILCLESYYVKLPGHIKNAGTFDFPVRYKIVKGSTPERIVKKTDMSLLEPFIKSAKELEEEGVKAITTSCGFLCLFQKELAESVDIPVYTSSLIQVPMISCMTGKKVGVITARKASLTNKHLKAIGIADSSSMVIVGMDGKDEFNKVILERKKTSQDVEKIRREILSVAKQLVKKDIGAVVLECTDLSPFSKDIQQIVKLPVFDIVTLTRMVHDAV